MMIGPELTNGAKRIGYARVSTKDQKLDIQINALSAVGCDQIFSDHGVSGSRFRRPGLDDALKALEPGDMLVVYKLCRLGRSVNHLAELLKRFRNDDIHFQALSEGISTTTIGGKLIYHIFASVAEFQRDLIRENTVLGIEAARQRGKQIGRPCKLNSSDIAKAIELSISQGLSVSQIAALHNVSYSTMRRSLMRSGLAELV